MIWLGTIFFGTLLIGMPIAFVLGISALGYFLATGQTQFLIALPQRMFGGMDQFVLLAIGQAVEPVIKTAEIVDRLWRGGRADGG